MANRDPKPASMIPGDGRRLSSPTVPLDDESMRALVEGIDECAIAVLNPAGFVLAWNAGAERLTGYARAAATGCHISFIYTHPSEDGDADRDLETAARHGRLDVDRPLRRSENAQMTAHISIRAVTNPAGALAGYSYVMTGLAARAEKARAEKQLIDGAKPIDAASEGFASIVQDIRDYAIFMLDREGHIASWNAGAQYIKGYRPEEIIGRHFPAF